MPTLKDAVQRYLKIYRLKEEHELSGHDALHAMTGYGIGLADEMRIALVEGVLCGEFNSGNMPQAMEHMKSTLRMGKTMAVLPFLYNDEENGLNKWKYRFNQLATRPLKEEEVREVCDMAQDIHKALMKLTGFDYRHVPLKMIMEIDFSKLDFSDQAREISVKHQIPENREVAVRSAMILRDAARDENGGILPPRAGRSWLDGLKR